MVDRQALRQTRVLARDELPADWLPIIHREASAAPSLGGYLPGNPLDARRVWEGYLHEFGGAAAAQLSDADIKAQARKYANEASDLDIGQIFRGDQWGVYVRLLEFCRVREVDHPPLKLHLKGMGARVRCQYWWRRALRKMVARKCERGFLEMGLVSSQNRQPYASNMAVVRRVDQRKRCDEAMAAITFENDEGYRRTLAELAAASVSNKAIRRGELMTRIRGCEQMAVECGHYGLFCTMTAPSRFHSTLWTGGRNPKFNGSTPRDAQQWLCGMWAKSRAKLQRQGVTMYGFRVAEPHHDGCTHWHMLIWFDSQAAAATFIEVVRAYWLSDDGETAGAKKYRCDFKLMKNGGAAGYIAKYISKNIDDHQIDSHHDDFGEPAVQTDLLGNLEIKPAMRVEAWASTWGIRQFQPLGQPPVTVWRELRRVGEAQARLAGVGGMIHKAWLAAQKVGTVLADWARYVKAQGGLMRGRNCRIKMRHDRREVLGQYGADVRAVPVGVALNCKGSATVWSERRLWRAVEVSPRPAPARAAQSAAPRTRVNNCTVMTLSDDEKLDALRGPGVNFGGWTGNHQPESTYASEKDHYPGSSPGQNQPSAPH